jgi:DNA-binding transcriptional MerR regulator
MGPWIRIGDFARLARTTVRTLRHYEDEGLLRPALRGQSRYRYYDAAQLLTWQRIVMLRELGLSIPDIRAVLTGGGSTKLLRAHREHLAETLAQQANQLEQMDALLREMTDSSQSPSPLPAMRVRSIPATTAYCLRAAVPSLGLPVMNLFETAERKAKSIRIDESPFLLFHSNPETRPAIDVEICIPVDPASPLPGIRLVEGAAAAGSLIYQGEYSQSETLFDRLTQWIRATGSEPAGPRREVYHRFGADVNGYELPARRLTTEAGAYVTELQLPFQRSP